MRGSLERARSELAERLRERGGEMEEALLTRTYAIADPTEAADSEYVQGLRAAVSAALDYGLEGIERGEERATPVPVLLLAQARLAARRGVSLDTVLRRYFAGYTLLNDFVSQEVGDVEGATIRTLMREQAAIFDRLITAVTDSHIQEVETRPRSTEARRAERVKRLLAGELLDVADLSYELDAYHLGAVATGPGAPDSLRALATTLDGRLLLVYPAKGTVWAWVGSRAKFDSERLGPLEEWSWPAESSVAIGEPGKGLSGWRTTHLRAQATLPIALRRGLRFLRYRDVALLSALLDNQLLSGWLRNTYLEPLARRPDLLETARAYLAASQNISSAAAALGVNRHTVTNRLRMIEQRLGRPLAGYQVELDAALRLDDLSPSAAEPPAAAP